MGWTVHHFDSIDSTNTWLLDRAKAGQPIDQLVCTAGSQTAGRGRLGRTWTQAPGSSVIASFGWDAIDAVDGLRCQRIIAVAACRAIESVTNHVLHPSLKWPNDVLLDDRKVAGILTETVRHDGALSVVVGIGINVKVGAYPPDLSDRAIAVEESLREVDSQLTVSPQELLDALIAHIDPLTVMSAAELDDVYQKLLITLGEYVTVTNIDGSTVTGVAQRVEPDGRLVVVSDSGESIAVAIGDVWHAQRHIGVDKPVD
jgi:BirA family biotin operon repressor/biotin-[acetyl-CoA-carboxylase] ligase